jgi:two-component system cell cycle response regulator
LIADASEDIHAALETLYAGGLVTLTVGVLLLVFFHRQVGLVGRRIEANEQALVQLATHDGLTGLYNHRTFYALLEEELTRARRYLHPVSLLMLDIDRFKVVNDTHGHQAGDAILRGLSKRLAEAVRSVDRVCRYGGEEIAVILPDSDAPLHMAERLRALVEAAPFEIAGSKTVGITVSIGLASFPARADSGKALVEAADNALYAAKQSGRNRVCSAE